MALANAINATTQGTKYQDSAGTWSGVDGGTASHVLTSNGTGVAPTFQEISSTFSGGIITAPVSSHTATVAFGQIALGTAKQNTLGYDILVNINIDAAQGLSSNFNIGVGPTSTPTVDSVSFATNYGVYNPFNFSAIVPSNYYILVTVTGSITVIGSVTQVSPL